MDNLTDKLSWVRLKTGNLTDKLSWVRLKTGNLTDKLSWVNPKDTQNILQIARKTGQIRSEMKMEMTDL